MIAFVGVGAIFLTVAAVTFLVIILTALEALLAFGGRLCFLV